MNIKFQDIINFNINSQRLTKGELPLTCAYKLTKISKILAEEADFYQTEFFKIVDEYGEKDEKGNIKYSEDGTVVLIEPSKQKEAQEKINDWFVNEFGNDSSTCLFINFQYILPLG